MAFKNRVAVYGSTFKPQLLIEEGFFSIFFIEKGFLEIKLGTQDKTISAGQILINTPTNFQIPTKVSDDCQVIGLKYTLDYLKEIKTLIHFYNMFTYFEYQYLPIWNLSFSEQELIANLLRKLKIREESIDDHLFGDQLFNLTFTEFILELTDIGSRQDKKAFHNYNRSEYLSLQFLILAREHYKEQTKLEFYADKLAVSVKYLSETVKSITSKTAKDILVELRISQARILLSSSDLDIAQIAFELSYDSPGSFSKFFKQVEGVSPKAYRELHL